MALLLLSTVVTCFTTVLVLNSLTEVDCRTTQSLKRPGATGAGDDGINLEELDDLEMPQQQQLLLPPIPPSLLEKARLDQPIEARFVYSSSASKGVMQIFKDLIRDTEAWSPVIFTSAQQCSTRNVVCELISPDAALLKVSCNDSTSIHVVPLSARRQPVSSHSLRRIIINNTQRCSELDQLLKQLPYTMVETLVQSYEDAPSNVSVVFYLDSHSVESNTSASQIKPENRPLIRELWLDALNQSHVTFLWAQSQGSNTDELLVIGPLQNVGFFDEDGSWELVEEGMRNAFRTLYVLNSVPHDYLRGRFTGKPDGQQATPARATRKRWITPNLTHILPLSIPVIVVLLACALGRRQARRGILHVAKSTRAMAAEFRGSPKTAAADTTPSQSSSAANKAGDDAPQQQQQQHSNLHAAQMSSSSNSNNHNTPPATSNSHR